MLMPNSMQDIMRHQQAGINRQGLGSFLVAGIVMAAAVGLLIWMFPVNVAALSSLLRSHFAT